MGNMETGFAEQKFRVACYKYIMKIALLTQISPKPIKSAAKTNIYKIIIIHNANYYINTCKTYK